MFESFPSVWLLLGLPFASSTAIVHMPSLRRLVAAHNRITWPLGLIALGFLIAELTGLLSPRHALPVIILAGILSGFAFFRLPHKRGGGGSDGDDWRRRRPPPDDPPPPPKPLADGPIDWARFDRLRAQWERPRVPGC